MSTKAQFICIEPKNQWSKEVFTDEFKSLHSCKVIENHGDKVYLKSIAGEYYFWINLDNDKNWKIIK